MSRRVPALVVTVVALAALVIVGRSAPAEVAPMFSAQASAWMPVAPTPSGLTGYWFCPGVPATGEEGVGGEVVVSNAEDRDLLATIELVNDAGESVEQSITVPAWGRTVFDADAALSGRFVSAVVEIEGGGGLVEQRAIHPAGDSMSPCANSTSAEWYVADGFTVDGSVDELLLTNPYDDAVIVDIGFATQEGSRVPRQYQGFPVAPRSVQVIDLGAPGVGAQGESVLAVKVEARRGRLVVGKAQHFLGGGRLGYTVSLAAPALRDQWWFADGVKGPGFAERFSIYNPTDDDVEVDVFFLGIPETPVVDPIRVPARQVVTFDPGRLPTLTEGRHAAVLNAVGQPSIVVERALTQTADGATSVLLGAPPRDDGYVARTWRLAIGPSEPGGGSITVYNRDNVASTVTIVAIGDDGPVPVPGLESVEIGPGGRRTIELEPDAAVGRELVVSSTSLIFVERSLPNGRENGRMVAWALPES